MVWFGVVWCLVWAGMVWVGMVWRGAARAGQRESMWVCGVTSVWAVSWLTVCTLSTS